MSRSFKAVVLQVVALLSMGAFVSALLAFGLWWVVGTTVQSAQSAGDVVLSGSPATIYETIQSPDGAYDAVVSEKNCGATCTFITRVEIVESGQSVDDGDGAVVLVVHDEPQDLDLDLRWLDDRSLLIVRSVSDTANRPVQEIAATVNEVDFTIEHGLKKVK